MNDDDDGVRRVSIDFVAIVLVGVALALLLLLNIFFTVWEHEHRSAEHDRLEEHVTQIERRMNAIADDFRRLIDTPTTTGETP